MVYVERGKLLQAQACLSHAHQLAPSEEYIGRHLQIVQTRITRLRQSPDGSREKEVAFADYDPREFGGNPSSGSLQDPQLDFQLFQGIVNNEKESEHQEQQQHSASQGEVTGGTAEDMPTPLPQQELLNDGAPSPRQTSGDPVFIESEGMNDLELSQTLVDDGKPAPLPDPTRSHEREKAFDHATDSSRSRSSRSSTRPSTSVGIQSASVTPHHQAPRSNAPVIGQDLDDPSSGMS